MAALTLVLTLIANLIIIITINERQRNRSNNVSGQGRQSLTDRESGVIMTEFNRSTTTCFDFVLAD